MNQPDADRRTDWVTIHLFGQLCKGHANSLRHFDRLLAAGFHKQCGEFFAAQSPNQVGTSHRFARGIGEYRQHAVADRVAKTVIDRLEVIEVDQQNGNRPRVGGMALREQ